MIVKRTKSLRQISSERFSLYQSPQTMESRRSLTLKDDENYNSILGFILMCQCANH